MKLNDFYYDLPEELIAQTPATPRDSSRLLVYDKESGKTGHKHFRDITNYLKPGDVLVVNNTRVLPARLDGIKEGSTTKAEFLLLKRLDLNVWETICKPGKKLRIGDRVVFSPELSCVITDKTEQGGRIIRFDFDGVFEDILSRTGSVPLPHYIKEQLAEKERYQTIYSKTEGSSAAPTAGLHFTDSLIDRIKSMGVIWTEVLLHVGLGTFRPVKTENILEHKMHSEYYEVPEAAAEAVNKAKKEGRRVIAVGTTSVRVLESAAVKKGEIRSGSGNTDIFIYPPYEFKIPDKIITNFHLPESTLIMLISAFLGREKTMEIYKEAIAGKYRFFSFGDAMFI